MKSIVRTLWGVGLQDAKFLGVRHDVLPFTTLNEKFGFEAAATLNASDVPNVRWFAIGNGGHSVTVGANSIPIPSPEEHEPTDTALFNHLPFVLRPVMNDLTAEQRDGYGGRTTMTLPDGGTYYAYWLKALDISETAVKYYKSTTVDGVTTTVPYVPDSSNLNPTKPSISSTTAVTSSGTVVYASAGVSIKFTAFDIAELLNVAKLLYGDESYAIISEIAICSGVSRRVSGFTAGNSPITYNEVIAAQIATFLSANHLAYEISEGFTKLLDIGESESLLTGSTNTVVTP